MTTGYLTRIAFWARPLALLALTACGHSHGCSGLSFPHGHGSGGSGGHSMGHASTMSGSVGGHARAEVLGGVGRKVGNTARTFASLASLAPLFFHSRTAAVGAAPVADDIKVLAEDPEVSAELVASDKAAFWVDRALSSVDSIVSVPLEGGLATTLYACPGDGISTISSLALDDRYVYWVETSDIGTPEMSYVRRMWPSGGAVHTVLTRRGTIKQIAVDRDVLYSLDEVSVLATRLADGSQTGLGPVWASSQGPAITAAEGAAYWLGTPRRSGQAIVTAAAPAFQPVTLSARESPVTAMSAFGPSLYWLEYGGPSSGSSVFAMDRAGGTPTRIFESSELDASSSYGHALLAADAEGAYWMVEGSGPTNDGAIYKGARDVAPRVVVSGIGGPGGVAVAGDWLVFTDVGQGLVVRAPK